MIRKIKSLDPKKDNWGKLLISEVETPNYYAKLLGVDCIIQGHPEGYGLTSKKVPYGYEYRFGLKTKISCDGGFTKDIATCKNFVVHQLFDFALGMLPEYQKILNGQKRKEEGKI